MVIDKNYPGLTRDENGGYHFDGDIVTDEDIDINLDGALLVSGSIEAGESINAGESIEAKTYISSDNRIFAGLAPHETADTYDKSIRCAELRSGEVGYGDLVIIDKIDKEEKNNEEL